MTYPYLEVGRTLALLRLSETETRFIGLPDLAGVLSDHLRASLLNPNEEDPDGWAAWSGNVWPSPDLAWLFLVIPVGDDRLFFKVPFDDIAAAAVGIEPTPLALISSSREETETT